MNVSKVVTHESDAVGTPVSFEVYQAACALKSNYFYCIDNKLWPQLRALFADDAQFDGFSFGGDGPDGFVQAVQGFLTDVKSVHQGSMPVLRALSDVAVRARWSMFDYLVWPPGSKSYRGESATDLCGFRAYGYYEEEYRLIDDRWKISFMRLTRLRAELLYGDDTGDTFGAPAPTLNWLP